jgi:hypothetical protein
MDPQLLARIQAMMQAGGGQQAPTTPFSQPPGTTLNSMGSPNPAPVGQPGQINPPQPTAPGAGGIQNPLTGNAMNMGGISKGVGQLAGALSPPAAASAPMPTPNLQPHQMNPQMLQMLMQQRPPGSPGGGGPFGDSQGYM